MKSNRLFNKLKSLFNIKKNKNKTWLLCGGSLVTRIDCPYSPDTNKLGSQVVIY